MPLDSEILKSVRGDRDTPARLYPPAGSLWPCLSLNKEPSKKHLAFDIHESSRPGKHRQRAGNGRHLDGP